MFATALIYLTVTALYTGFQWTVRIVVYPQFVRVGAAEFVAYECAHQRAISMAVGPLFLAWGLSALALLAFPGSGWDLTVRLGAVGLVGAVLVVTAMAAVPLHRKLSDGFDAATHRQLLRVDTVRLIAAVTATALGVIMVITS